MKKYKILLKGSQSRIVLADNVAVKEHMLQFERNGKLVAAYMLAEIIGFEVEAEQ